MKYVFDEIEFISILSISGVKTIYGFEYNKNVADETIINKLLALYKKGFIEQKDSKIVVSEKILRLIDKMLKAKYIFIITDCLGNFPQSILYCNEEKIVVLERYENEFNISIKLSETTKTYFLTDSIENGLFPKNFTEDEEEVKLIEKMLIGNISNKENLLLIEKLDIDEPLENRYIKILKSNTFKLIQEDTLGREKLSLYTYEALPKIFLS